MDIKIEQLREIERLQLTPQEISVLKLLAQLEPENVALLEGVSKQRVSQVKISAIKKLEVQGFVNKRGHDKNHKPLDLESDL